MPLKNDVKFTNSALDSDSDDESDVGSGVTLGFCDGHLSIAKEAKESSYTNKIGGLPSFSPVLTTAPDTSSASCRVCDRAMPLVAQLFCPLSSDQVEGSESGRELWQRLIYIWACVHKECQRKEGSVRAFRALRRVQASKKGKEKEAAPSNPFSFSISADNDIGSSIFGSTATKDVANPFSALSLTSEALDEAEEESAKVSENDMPAPSARWDTSDLPRLPAQYLATSEEPSSRPANTEGFQTVSRRSSSSSTTQEKGWQGEQYEHQHLSGLDFVYLKFQDTVMVRSGGELSDQVLRYERAGAPLPFCVDEAYETLFNGKKYDASKVERCSCGSRRVFEVQLMPQIVSYLSKDGLLKDKEDEMEITWSAVWVFCCEKDCGIDERKEEAWKEEKCMLQYE